MKIGIVCYPTYGGSGVVATELGNALAQKGHEIHFITYDLPVRMNTFNPNIRFHQVSMSEYPLFEYPPYELALASKLVDVTKHEKLDLLHLHYAIPHASAAYMAQQILLSEGIKLPFITTLHGTDITIVGNDSSYAPAVTFAINNSNAVTAVSNSLKQDTLNLFKINTNIDVIYNFICPKQYQIDGDKALKNMYSPNEEKILIHISNLREVKKVDDIIKAFKLIQDEIPSKLLIVGDGPERHYLESLTRNLELTKKVHFIGKLKSVKEILSISDLFLMASEHESFGLSALEAMASGTPVVSTDAGGIPEVNKNGLTGYTVSVGDYESMAKKSIEILSNHNQFSKMKNAAFEQAENFSLNKILPKYEDLYVKTINGFS